MKAPWFAVSFFNCLRDHSDHCLVGCINQRLPVNDLHYDALILIIARAITLTSFTKTVTEIAVDALHLVTLPAAGQHTM